MKGNEHTHKIKVAAVARGVVNAEGSSRHNLTGHLFRAARRFAELLRQHEQVHGTEFGQNWDPAFGLGSAAFIMAHAAAEAALNEAAADGGIPHAVMRKLSKGDVLERTQKVLKACGQPPLKAHSEPRVSMRLLTDIRDALVHFKPEWSDKKGEHYQLSERLISAKVPLNPNLSNPVDAFPLACMTADCADWAVSNTELFINEIRTRLGTEQRPL